MTQPIVVHPPSLNGGRRVTAHSQVLGLAHSREDVEELLRNVGLPPERIQLDDPDLIEWRGGGPDVWS